MSARNQNEMVLSRLRRGSLTQLQAYEELGITRLGARVYDLRMQGHEITAKTVTRTNRHGQACRVAEYAMEVTHV